MDNYIVKRISCIVLSLLLTAALVLSIFGITGIALFRSTSFIVSKSSQYSDAIAKSINSEIEQQMPVSKLTLQDCKAAIDGGVCDYIVSVTAKNIAHKNANDFSLDTALYNKIYANLTSAAKGKDISISADEIGDIASLEVDVINSVMAQMDTNNIAYISLFYSKFAGAAVLVSVALVIAAIFLLDFVNSGRHRKNSYIGMSFASAGAIDIFASLAILRFGTGLQFSQNEVLSSIVADALQTVLKLQIPCGAALVLVGYLVLFFNYRYFSKKNVKVREQREVNAKMREDYMRHYEQKNAPRPEPKLGEREEHLIDF